MNAIERLNEEVIKKGPLLAGLDPDVDKIRALYEKIGKFSRKSYLNQENYNKVILYDYCVSYIEAVKDKVAAIKINIAFFEAHHMEELFWIMAGEAKEAGLFVIADVKRADIGNTSKQYAEAFLRSKSIDAITINPYFGTDGVQPFLDVAKENDKAVFVLVKTSNPSSAEIQDLQLANGKRLYHEVAALVKQWGEYAKSSKDEGKYSLVGAVVGATHPEEAKELREMLPETFFLVPGYGAQGATAEDIVENFDSFCGGAIVNSSRGLMFACEKKPWKDRFPVEDWEKATGKAVNASQKELKQALNDRRYRC